MSERVSKRGRESAREKENHPIIDSAQGMRQAGTASSHTGMCPVSHAAQTGGDEGKNTRTHRHTDVR